MPKYLNLQINEPCHEDWNVMTPNEQGRYCGSCKKTVVDFTAMTDGQVVDFFKLNTGNTCGRFYDDQLNKSLVIPRKEIPWLKYFFTITLPAFLFSAKAIAKKKIIKQQVEKSDLKNKLEIDNSNSSGYRSGGYTNNDSLSIPDKKAVMKSYWNNPPKQKDTVKLMEETLPEVIVYGNPGLQKTWDIISGSVAVTSTSLLCKTSGVVIKKTPAKPIKEESKLNIFPNPTPANAVLNLSFSKDIIGEIIIEVFTANGNLVKKETKTFAAKTKTTFINTNNLPFGFYICVATNTTTNEKLSKEFLVK